MSTRSMIIIKYGNTKLNFYRHHDGYLAEGGYDLSVLFKHYNRPASLITAMINRQRGIYIGDLDCPLYSIEPNCNMGEEYTYILDFEAGTTDVKLYAYRICRPPHDNEKIFHSSGRCEVVADEFYKLCCEKRGEMERQWINKIS